MYDYFVLGLLESSAKPTQEVTGTMRLRQTQPKVLCLLWEARSGSPTKRRNYHSQDSGR